MDTQLLRHVNTLSPGKVAATMTDDIFQLISFNEGIRSLNKISLKYIL